MSHYTMYESIITRKYVDIPMMSSRTLNLAELVDGIEAIGQIRGDTVTASGSTVSEIRVMIVDATIKLYFDIEE